MAMGPFAFILFSTLQDVQKVDHYTRPPRSVKTRPFPCKAAADGKPEAYTFSPTRPKRAKTRSFPGGLR